MKEEFDAVVEQLLSCDMFLEQAIELVERGMIQGALKRSGGKVSPASKALGIHRNTLQRKIVLYQLGTPRPRRKPAARAGQTRKRKTA